MLVVPRGVPLSGRVLDPDGVPVADAEVLVGFSQFDANLRKAKTDKEGRFSISSFSPRYASVTVQAPNFAPTVQPVDQLKLTDPIELRMEHGKRLDLSVADTNGNPIEGADVTVTSAAQEIGGQTWSLKAKSDADGKVSWAHAPTNPVIVQVYKKGLKPTQPQRIQSGTDSQVITLQKPTKTIVDVLDADTGKPIDDFTVLLGVQFGTQIVWQRFQLKTGRNGRYEHTFAGNYGSGEQLRIDAPGYRPAVSPFVSNKDVGQDLTWTIHLARGVGAKGLVRAPDGNPLAGASVFLVNSHPQLNVQNGMVPVVREGEEHPRAETNAEGQFSLPIGLEPGTVAVVCDRGYAEVSEADLAQTGEITIRPWGRIEGKISNTPAGSIQKVNLDISNEPKVPRIAHFVTIDSNQDGTFIFERVPQGVAKVRLMTPAGNSWTTEQQVAVVSDETSKITFGEGATVTGQIGFAPDEAHPAEWELATNVLVPADKSSPIDDPEWSSLTPAERVSRLHEWEHNALQSDAGTGRSKFFFRLDDDGRFRVAGVPSGEYTLSVNVYGRKENNRNHKLATAVHTVRISTDEMAARKAIDLGILPAVPMKPLEKGGVAPDFGAKMIDGGTLRLTDLRGKYVVLDFWATWCGPCIASLPELKANWQPYADDDRIVFLSLSVDEELTKVVEYVGKDQEKMPWRQGYLGPWSQSLMPTAYGVEGIPALFVVGPDGKLIERTVAGARLEALLAQQLTARDEVAPTEPTEK